MEPKPPLLSKRLAWGGVLVLLLTSHAANACIDFAPLELEDIRHSDAVFTGRVVRYEIVSPGVPDTLDDYALLTIRVDEAIKGNVAGDVELYWWNSTFDFPEPLRMTEPAAFAAVTADRSSLPLRAASGTVFASRRPELLQLLQAPCSSPFILPASPKALVDIRTILRGGSVEDESALAYDSSLPQVEVPAIHRGERSGGWLFAAMAVVLGLGLLVAVALWRRRRRAAAT